MDDISIKLLDALFDLVDGENYVIVEKDDITSRVSDYAFETDEITEILESLSADGLIDLKYADNEEFCVAMKTKGRALIRQSRERLQKLIEADNAAIQKNNIVVEGPIVTARDEARIIHPIEEDKPAPEEIAREETTERLANREELLRAHREMRRERERLQRDSAPREYATAALSRGYAAHSEEEGKKSPQANKRAFLYGFLGAAAGALLINLIFLIIFLVKFTK